MLCCCVTISSTVVGRRGSYWDTQYPKVSLANQSLALDTDDTHTYIHVLAYYNTLFFILCVLRVHPHTHCTGATAYVLTESPTGVGYWLWNPHTGKHYTQHEPYTPLTSVGCAINEENVRSIVIGLMQ